MYGIAHIAQQHTATHCNTLQHTARQHRMHVGHQKVLVCTTACYCKDILTPYTPVRRHRVRVWCQKVHVCSTVRYYVYVLTPYTPARWHCGAAATLHHTAPHCTTLHHTATHCNTLKLTASHCNTLQHTATHGNTLQHIATHCNTLQNTATHCASAPYACRVSESPCVYYCMLMQGYPQTLHTCTSAPHVCMVSESPCVFYCMLLCVYLTPYTPARRHCGVAATLHQTAPRCTTLHHTATHCNTLQHTATHCNTRQHTQVTCASAPRRSSSFTTALCPCDAAICSNCLQCVAVRRSVTILFLCVALTQRFVTLP